MLAEADMGITQMAMSDGSQNQGDEQLLVVFYIHPKQNEEKSKQAGRAIFEDREYIRIIQPGNKENIIERPASEMDIQRFPRHYQAFKQRTGNEELIEGTRLEEWPALTRSQVAELKYMNVMTVEQLANLSDANAQGFMGINLLKQKAKAFLEVSETNKAAEELTELRNQNALLMEKMEAMQSEFAAMQEAAKPAPKRKARSKVLDEEDSQEG